MFSVARTTRGDDGEARSAMGTTRAAREGTSTWSALDDDGFWEARDQNDDPNGTFGGRLEKFERSLEALCVGFAEGRGEGGRGVRAPLSRASGEGGVKKARSTAKSSRKRREMTTATATTATARGDARIVEVKTSEDPTRLDDGFRWRKYGNKFLSGQKYPRAYYKCTSGSGIGRLQKHVEKTGDATYSITYLGVSGSGASAEVCEALLENIFKFLRARALTRNINIDSVHMKRRRA